MIVDVLSQAWPPFVLVTGLLLLGEAAAAEGVFEWLGAVGARAPLPPPLFLAASLTVVALVTALMNLDTSAVFMTPVLVHTARRRGLDERPFLYGSLAMSNSASTLLPGSNLTNMLVLHGAGPSGVQRAGSMLPAWLAGCALTGAVVAAAFWPRRTAEPSRTGVPTVRIGPGAAACVAAAGLVVALPNPAVPVLGLGLVAAARRGRLRSIVTPWIPALFAVSVAVGTMAHAYAAPWRALGRLDPWPAAFAGAAAAVAVNNLPAAMLLSAGAPEHPAALLLGLDLGPNLAVTGSLSAVLWLRAARTAGAQPSLRTVSALGLALVPITLAGSLAALSA
jgi:arsenical pump membrane protein